MVYLKYLIIVFLLIIFPLVEAQEKTSDNTITVELTKRGKVALEIEEKDYFLGDFFLVERYIKFVNFSLNYFILKETFSPDLDRYYIDYEQYDYLNNKLLKRESYIEARWVGKNKLQVEFPRIDSINKTDYVVLERFKVGYNRSKYTDDFIFPFDQSPYNRTLEFRGVGNIYSVQLIIPKTYEAKYYKNNLAIQGFFVDKQIKNLSGIKF